MIEIILFYLVCLLLSLIGFPVARKIFTAFPDRGYAFGRTIGILAFAYTCWILSYSIKFPINFVSTWIILTTLISIIYFFVKIDFGEIKSLSKIILIEEAIFFCFFFAMVAYRGFNPKIEGIEKFMDFAIINNLYRSEILPPVDTWYSGATINYYYFGHYFLAVINKLTQIQTSISYNLNVCLIFALAALNIFSVSLKIIKNKIFSLFNSFILVSAGNLYLFFNTANDYSYTAARSLIAYTINEFPSYSFIISDLHAHILDIPFVLLFIALLVNFFLEKDSAKNRYALFLSALTLGALAVTNSWDFIIYAPLLIIVLLLRGKNYIKNIFVAGSLCALALSFFAFYFFDYKPAIGGIGFVKDHIGVIQLMRMFGYFAFSFVALLIVEREKIISSKENILIVLIFTFALVLALTPNVIFIKDIYFKFTPLYYRANTVFKFWYQAWILFSLIPGFALLKLFQNYKKSRIIITFCFVLFVFFTLYIFRYPLEAYAGVLGAKPVYKGLDGSAYLDEQYSAEKKIIDWLNQSEQGQPVVLEAVGESYTMGSLISSYTGLPTILGWSDHELGWRDNWPEISTRMGEVERLYLSNDLEEIHMLIKKYDVKYIVIGKNEKAKYGFAAGESLREISDLILISNESELRAVY